VRSISLNKPLALIVILTATGCASTQDELLPQDGPTMQDIYLGAPVDEDTDIEIVDSAPFTRDDDNQTRSQFQRLPNPDLLIFIYPHLATKNRVPIPGYSTVIPLYERVEYRLPGETAR
jgi:hypothetical protein